MPDESSSSSSSLTIVIDPMPSSSSSGSPGGGGGGGGRPRNPALPNQAVLDELLKAEDICHKAEKTGYAPKLAEREITTALISATLVKIQQARVKSALATDRTTDRFGKTDAEAAAKKTLLAFLTEMQKAAKQKFRTEPGRLADYYIGERIDQNRARLEQLGEQMIAKAAADALPGIKLEKITAANAALATYKAADDEQGDSQSEATGARGGLKVLMAEITDTRIRIQLAADAEWPHQNPENAGIRREFQLPPNRAMKG